LLSHFSFTYFSAPNESRTTHELAAITSSPNPRGKEGRLEDSD
jgi:hypothetical protein